MWNLLRCKNTFQLPFVFYFSSFISVSISTLAYPAEHKQNARHTETKFDTRLGAQMDCTMNCRCSCPATCALSPGSCFMQSPNKTGIVSPRSPKKIYLYLSYSTLGSAAIWNEEKQRLKSVREHQLGELSALFRLVCVINYGKASSLARR